MGPPAPLSKSMGAWKASECEKTIGFPCIFDIPKMGILEVDKPKPVSELAQDVAKIRISQKQGSAFSPNLDSAFSL